MRGAFRRFWVLWALVALWPPGCLGGQTGDPNVRIACGGPSAAEIHMTYQGDYESPAVRGPTPETCVASDTVLHLEVGADLGGRREGPCSPSHVLVEVSLTSEDGFEHSFSGWLDTRGVIEPAKGERVDPNEEWSGQLSVSPDDGTFSLSSPTLSTLPPCCMGIEPADIARALTAGGAGGEAAADCP